MFGKRNRGTHVVGAVLMAGSLVLGLTGCGGSGSDERQGRTDHQDRLEPVLREAA